MNVNRTGERVEREVGRAGEAVRNLNEGDAEIVRDRATDAGQGAGRAARRAGERAVSGGRRAGEAVGNLNRGDAEIVRDRAEDTAQKLVDAAPEMGLMAVQTGNLVVFIGMIVVYTAVLILFGVNREWKTILAAAFFLLYVGVQYGFNYLAVNTINKDIKPGLPALKALYPVAFLGIFYILLSAFPAWTSVFGNTVGLLYVKFAGVNKILNGDGSEDGLLRQDKESKIAGKMFGSNTNFINTVNTPGKSRIDPECYAQAIREMPKAFNMTKTDLIDKFSALMVKRHVISESIWLLLVGIAFSVSSCMSLVSGMELL
jgi:hypothetical protein